jgi:hypothetical protein
MEIYGKIYKQSDDSYIINDGMYQARLDSAINIEMVKSYLAEHPEALVPEPMPPEPSVQEKAAMKAISDEAAEVDLDMTWLRQQRLKG